MPLNGINILQCAFMYVIMFEVMLLKAYMFLPLLLKYIEKYFCCTFSKLVNICEKRGCNLFYILKIVQKNTKYQKERMLVINHEKKINKFIVSYSVNDTHANYNCIVCKLFT